MDAFSTSRVHRGRGDPRMSGLVDRGRRGQSKNKTWVPVDVNGSRSGSSTPDSRFQTDRWERGVPRGTRGRGRGRGRERGPSVSPRPEMAPLQPSEDIEEDEGMEDTQEFEAPEVDEENPEFDNPEEFDRFYKELEKARDVERDKAVAEGKMNHPTKPRRLDEAITIVGTCMDMCPRFERYTREKRNLLMRWEMKPGTKHVDHKRAVKQYERGGGDKSLPSDLRPPPVLKRTLDYLFHELLPKEGFEPTYSFIRDRTRQVRADFTIQIQNDAVAMECHERCVRYHILVLHFMRGTPGFEFTMEESVLMNALQSLKEFYHDQRGTYASPNELEMRIYHRLIHMRDQRERHDDIPAKILKHPVFLLTTRFREHVQKESSPIQKNSPLKVGAEGMEIFSQLSSVLQEQGNRVMIYLVACILERFFGVEKIENIDGLRVGMELPQIIDGLPDEGEEDAENAGDANGVINEEDAFLSPEEDEIDENPASQSLKPSATEWLSSNFGTQPTSTVFGTSTTGSSAFGPSTSAFGATFPSASSPTPQPPVSAFGVTLSASAFGNGTGSVFGSGSAFGGMSGGAFKTGSPFGAQFGVSASTSNLPTTNGHRAPQPVFGGPSMTESASPFDAPQSAFGIIPSQSAPPTIGLGSIAQSSRPDNRIRLDPTAPPFNPSKIFSSPVTFGKVTPQATVNGSSSASPSHPVPPTRPILTPLTTTPFPTAPSNIASGSSLKPTSTGSAGASPASRLQRKQTLTDSSGLPTPKKLFDAPPLGEGAPQTPGPQSPPPALTKIHPISLPPTPTVSSFDSPTKSRPGNSLFGWPSLSSVSAPEILSPLHLSGPGLSSRTSVGSFSIPSPSPLSTRSSITGLSLPPVKHPSVSDSPSPPSPLKTRVLSPSKIAPAPAAVPNGKGKERAVDYEGLAEKAADFSRHSLLVKDSWNRWVKRALDRAAWTEAVRRSDEYNERIQQQRLSGDLPGLNGKKCRDPSRPAVEEKSPPRRVRRRVSSRYTPPRTDAELVQRLKENHEQHERRWAPGSFLHAIRAHVEEVAGTYPFDWRIWLSTNPDNDGTAIWVEKKFDVPTSGKWFSERVFSIPLAPGDEDSSSPGLVVFECSPLEGVGDEIEAKYRILDDCTRLRDIVEAFPEDRHFVPAIVFIIWGENEKPTVPDDLLHMASVYENQGVVLSKHTFALSTKTTDLDEKFTTVLSAMEFDLKGKLVEVLNSKELLQLVVSPWTEFANDWTSRCLADGEVDWYLYCQVLQNLVELMNTLCRRCVTRIDASASTSPVPALTLSGVTSSDALYDAVFAWLDSPELGSVSRDAQALLKSHQSLRADFPIHNFVEHLYELCLHRIEASLDANPSTRYPVPNTDIQAMKRGSEQDVADAATSLRNLFAFYVRPKRPAPDDEFSGFSPSHSSKRLKSSESTYSVVEDRSFISNGDASHGLPPPSMSASPSTSIATVTDDSPPRVVTIAMLRALSKNVLKHKGRF